ncbi:MAG: NAD-dependent epimerase/dehydratase family protein [Flavobacteriales bacterium]|jgi:nucleoside-diphosphate-sugar epimerase
MGQLRVLITGAQGFLGQHFMRFFENRPMDAFLGLTRGRSNASSHLQTIDYDKEDELLKIFYAFKPNVILHLASNISRTRDFSEIEDFLKDNVGLTQKLLDASLSMVENPLFVYFSTSEVYGPQEGILKEDALPRPVSPYGYSKWAAERLVKHYHDSKGLPALVLRIFNVYGTHQPSPFFMADLVSAYEQKKPFIMTKGEQARDFIYVDDLIRAVEILINSYETFDTINICSGKPLSLKQVVEEFIEMVGKENLAIEKSLPYRAHEIWCLAGDNSKLHAKGFTPQYSLRDGLHALIKR